MIGSHNGHRVALLVLQAETVLVEGVLVLLIVLLFVIILIIYSVMLHQREFVLTHSDDLLSLVFRIVGVGIF